MHSLEAYALGFWTKRGDDNIKTKNSSNNSTKFKDEAPINGAIIEYNKYYCQ